MDEIDEEFEDMKAQCEVHPIVEAWSSHHWVFPVAMGDWCLCGQKRWGE